VLAVAALRHVGLHHGFKVHGGLLACGVSHRIPLTLT
jgi:hypothetical protein